MQKCHENHIQNKLDGNIAFFKINVTGIVSNLESVMLCNFFDGGSLKARIFDKNQHTQKKSLHFVNKMNNSS